MCKIFFFSKHPDLLFNGKVEFKKVWRDPSVLSNAFIACTGHLYLYTVLMDEYVYRELVG
jgi:hypothetical protein